MNDQELAERMRRADAYWNGPRLMMLLGGTLAAALTVIYIASSLYYGNYTWNPLAHDPGHEILPSD